MKVIDLEHHPRNNIPAVCDKRQSTEWLARYVITTRINGYTKSRYSPRDPKYPEASTNRHISNHYPKEINVPTHVPHVQFPLPQTLWDNIYDSMESVANVMRPCWEKLCGGNISWGMPRTEISDMFRNIEATIASVEDLIAPRVQ